MRAALVAFALAGFGAAAEAQPARGMIRVGTDVDAQSLDPRLQRETTGYRVNNLVYSGLVALDQQLVPRPDLATSWENPDPRTWIFQLRHDAKFHDGRPLTAADVVFTFRTILDPALNARFRSLYTPIDAIEAGDDHTVRITLKEPYAPLLSYLDVGIVPKHLVESGRTSTSRSAAGRSASCAGTAGSRIVLEANPDYSGRQAEDHRHRVRGGRRQHRARPGARGGRPRGHPVAAQPAGHPAARPRPALQARGPARPRRHLPQLQHAQRDPGRPAHAPRAGDAGRPGDDRQPDLRGHRPGRHLAAAAVARLELHRRHPPAGLRRERREGAARRDRLEAGRRRRADARGQAAVDRAQRPTARTRAASRRSSSSRTCMRAAGIDVERQDLRLAGLLDRRAERPARGGAAGLAAAGRSRPAALRAAALGRATSTGASTPTRRSTRRSSAAARRSTRPTARRPTATRRGPRAGACRTT